MTTPKKALPRNHRITRELTYGLLVGQTRRPPADGAVALPETARLSEGEPRTADR